MSKGKKNKGFTLIEIMIAVFILVTALLGLISTTVVIIKGNSLSRTMTTATTLAKDQMEQLKNTAYDSLTDGTDTQESIYTRTWDVTKDSPAAGMTTVEVKVDWRWQGASNQVVLKTIVAKL